MSSERKKDKEIRRASEDLRKTLAENVFHYRKFRHLSQEDLADLCGLHRTYIGSIERRERNVTLSTLEVIASALCVSVPELLTEQKYQDE